MIDIDNDINDLVRSFRSPHNHNTFITPLCSIPVRIPNTGLKKLIKKHTWIRELTSDLIFIDEHGFYHVIPKGFSTDGGSIPKALRWLITPFAPHMAEQFVLHDWFYRSHTVTRKRADQILYVSAQGRVHNIKRKSIYRAVRLAGSSAYKKRGEDRYERQ
jgi:hypothetical protein